MTQNVLELWPQIWSVVSGAFIILLFGLAFALPNRSKTLPGSKGHRDEPDGEEVEEIRADGYIDSFAGTIEEAGGGMPPIVLLALPGVILWWLVYLLLFWNG